MPTKKLSRGGYETILVIVIAIVATFLVSGLPFGSLPHLTPPGPLISQTTVIPQNNTQGNAIHLNTINITSSWGGGGASGNIVWLNYTSPVEFDPHTHDDGWIGSQCSQASMAEIFNYYLPLNQDESPQYKIVDLETWAQTQGIWEPVRTQTNSCAGLCDHAGSGVIAEANHYGFKVVLNADFGQGGNGVPDNNRTTNADIDTIMAIVKQGHPLMISAPDHWFVIWGEDSQGVWALDSAHNYTYTPENWPNPTVPVYPQPFKIPRCSLLANCTSYDTLHPFFPWTGRAIEIVPAT